jgi:purine-binding chemotaxis protein CheW
MTRGAAPGDFGGLDRLSDAPAFVTLTIADQLCGVPVLAVRDILRGQAITRIPLAPPEIAGNLNLRGRIVTAIDVRRRLNVPPAAPGFRPMSVITEQDGELYALQVDQVCEVLIPETGCFDPDPPTLPPAWSRYCAGLYRLETTLMLVLDLPRLLGLTQEGP